MTVQWHKSTCPYCGVGCGLMVGVEAGKVVEVRGMPDHPVNRGNICALASGTRFCRKNLSPVRAEDE